MTPKKFASHADVEERQVSFTQQSEHTWVYTAEGDPNTGIVIGDDAVLVADAQATPAMAEDVIRRIRDVTDKSIKYVVLTQYHGRASSRGVGVPTSADSRYSGFRIPTTLLSREASRTRPARSDAFPDCFVTSRAFRPGMTWPTMTIPGRMTLRLTMKSQGFRCRQRSLRPTLWQRHKGWQPCPPYSPK
ncbi:hypothetical protein D3C71_738820 [compost metagenome]|jgi:hypothetical protein